MSAGFCGEVSTPTALPLAMLDVVSMCVPLVTTCTSSGAASGERQEVEVLRALILRGEVDASAVFLPRDALRRAIPRARDHPRVAAVDVHHVELAVLPGVLRPVVAGVGDALAVGRDLRVAVGSLALRQLRDRAGVDVDRVDFRLAPLVLGVLDAQRAEEDLLAVRASTRRRCGASCRRSAAAACRRSPARRRCADTTSSSKPVPSWR